MTTEFRFTGTSALGPVLAKDSRLKNGSLLLMNFGNAFGNPGPGTPAGGTTVPNIAWKELRTVLGGVGTEASLALPVTTTFVQGNSTGQDGYIQRTGRGAPHFLVSQTNAVDGHVYSYNMPADLATYINGAGKGHLTYLSVTPRITRAGGAGAGGSQYMVRVAQNLTNVRQGVVEGSSGTSFFAAGNSTATVSNTSAGQASPGLGSVGVAVNGTAATSILSQLTIGGVLSSAFHLKAPSWILYDLYMEDLTISGLTFAQAEAERIANYNAMFQEGGMFYGDTWNNPATVAP